MNTQLQERSDRPDVFFGMNDVEMDQVWRWLENEAPQIRGGDLSDVHALSRDGLYERGVELGLNAIGLGHSMLPGASVLSRPWVDAIGTEWQWDKANLQPVSNRLEANLDARDFSDLPDEDFAVFVRGLLDSAAACGWMASQNV
ncbi:MAG: hypothetical protein ACYCS8_07835 [Acidithiobacillus sp.]|uniref:hypothetical protein n=1 Tax=Acidithiobacillus thiooxidans TaxID=930 RepID=UPI0009DA4FBE|nr:hypothetical protein [Acidithiobacillus thiooxidans]